MAGSAILFRSAGLTSYDGRAEALALCVPGVMVAMVMWNLMMLLFY